MSKYIFIFNLAILSSLLQISFIAQLSNSWSNFNLILSSLIFISFFSLRVRLGTAADFNLSLIWVIVCSLILEYFSLYSLSSFLIPLAFSLVWMYFILLNFLTNRSIYSLMALAILSTIAYNLFFYAYIGFLNWFGWTEFYLRLDVFLLSRIFYQIIYNLLFVLAAYWFLNWLKRRLNIVWR